MAVRFEGHYDKDADIAWLRFEGYDGSSAVAEEMEWGLREVDPASGQLVALEFWRASERLPSEFLGMLPPPGVEIAA